jgi:hypothetical protein
MRAIGCGTQLGDQMLVNISFFLFFLFMVWVAINQLIEGHDFHAAV